MKKMDQVLDWSKGVSVISGIAKGIGYLHTSEENKQARHQNISVDKVLTDQQFKPLSSEDSAGMGYLTLEYIRKNIDSLSCKLYQGTYNSALPCDWLQNRADIKNSLTPIQRGKFSELKQLH